MTSFKEVRFHKKRGGRDGENSPIPVSFLTCGDNEQRRCAKTGELGDNVATADQLLGDKRMPLGGREILLRKKKLRN